MIMRRSRMNDDMREAIDRLKRVMANQPKKTQPKIEKKGKTLYIVTGRR